MKKLHKSYTSGFTLIELLAVIAITGVVGSMMFGILFATLQGANKSDSLGIIQQNGNSVLGQISRMVRFSTDIQDPSTCYSAPTPTPVEQPSITILSVDNNATTFACDLSAGTIASNGASLIDNSDVKITACSFTCTQLTPYTLPTMTISFTLGKKNSNNLVENNSSQQFQTSVTVRNSR